MKREKALRIGFVVYGLVMAMAIFFVFIPNEGMIWIGRKLGLPPYEVTPVFEYMARGMSALCFSAGLLFVYIGLHLGECRRLVRFIGWIALPSLPMVILLHAKLPTPWWWKAGDFVGTLLLCVLCFATPREKQERAEGRLSS